MGSRSISPQQRQHRRQVLALRLDAERQFAQCRRWRSTPASSLSSSSSICLARVLLGAAHHHAGRGTASALVMPLSESSLPKRSVSWPVTTSPRVFFGSRTALTPLDSLLLLGALLDVGGGRIEQLAGRDGLAALVILDQRGHVRRRGDGGRCGCFVGNVHADGAVAALEIRLATRFTSAGVPGDAVAVQEEQPPVALGRPVAERRRRSRLLSAISRSRARGELGLGAVRLPRAVILLALQASPGCRVMVSRTASSGCPFVDADENLQHAGIVPADGDAPIDARGLLRLDQGLVEPARRLRASRMVASTSTAAKSAWAPAGMW